ncbi:MAG TPA: amidohydrolase family protein [Actinomycetota bacterium]|jgi:aminocarboxymuconate-semialdehyde decarboxylase
MIVDVHAHVIVEAITRAADRGDRWRPEVAWRDGAQVVEFGGREIRSAKREFVRIDRILEEEAASRIDHVVLSPWVQLLPYDLTGDEALRICRIQNEALSEIASAHAGRVSAVGAVPMQEPEVAARELEKLMGLPRLRGIEVAASVRGLYLGDDRFTPVWEAAEETGAVVFVHPTTRGFDVPVLHDYYLWNTVGNPVETAVTAAHLVMAGVLERHPALRVVLSHGGGALMSVRGRLRHAHGFQAEAQARLGEAPGSSLRRFFYDTVTHDPGLLRDLIEFAGPGQVLLGSDRPFDMGTDRPVEEVRGLGLSPDQEEAILGGNAGRLFRIGSQTA